MRNEEQIRAKYQRIEEADKSLRQFLTAWKADHNLNFDELGELLEAAQLDAEAGDLSFKELDVDEIISDLQD